jgi:elongation factor P
MPMATISTADFKKGMGIVFDGKKCVISDFQHVKPGKGGAFVRYTFRDIVTNRVYTGTVNAGTKFETVHFETSTMNYLYNDGTDYYFMDPNTYDQISLPADRVGDAAQWLKENDPVTLDYADGQLIGVEPQMFVELEVTQTDPGFKGDTVQGATKPATLETGAEVKVPMYVEVGDVLQIDTRDGRFIKRM